MAAYGTRIYWCHYILGWCRAKPDSDISYPHSSSNTRSCLSLISKVFPSHFFPLSWLLPKKDWLRQLGIRFSFWGRCAGWRVQKDPLKIRRAREGSVCVGRWKQKGQWWRSHWLSHHKMVNYLLVSLPQQSGGRYGTKTGCVSLSWPAVTLALIYWT